MSERITINDVQSPAEFRAWLKCNSEAILGALVVTGWLYAAIANPHEHSIEADTAISVPCGDGSGPNVASDNGSQITLDCRGNVAFLDREYPVKPIKTDDNSKVQTPTLKIVTTEGVRDPIVELEDSNRIMKISGVEDYVLVA